MREVSLIRITPPLYNRPIGGVLRINGEPLLVTLEPPFSEGLKTQHPCIPTGEYVCKKTHDRKTTGGLYIPLTYEVTGVPRRSGILFHVGNFKRDTQGCILVGLHYDRVNGELAVKYSRIAFKKFIEAMETDDEFLLKVIQS